MRIDGTRCRLYSNQCSTLRSGCHQRKKGGKKEELILKHKSPYKFYRKIRNFFQVKSKT